MTTKNSFASRAALTVDGKTYTIFVSPRSTSVRRPRRQAPVQPQDSARESAAQRRRGVRKARRHRGDGEVGRRLQEEREIAFRTSRVLLQDFTGVPAVVDLAAMRDAIKALAEAHSASPPSAGHLVIDHSVQVDEYGRPRRS